MLETKNNSGLPLASRISIIFSDIIKHLLETILYSCNENERGWSPHLSYISQAHIFRGGWSGFIGAKTATIGPFCYYVAKLIVMCKAFCQLSQIWKNQRLRVFVKFFNIPHHHANAQNQHLAHQCCLGLVSINVVSS